jgi:hypothetical protein
MQKKEVIDKGKYEVDPKDPAQVKQLEKFLKELSQGNEFYKPQGLKKVS